MAGTHSTKSPSGAKRLHGCSGALPFIASLPEEQRNVSGRAAQMGTAAHFLLEKCLREKTRPIAFANRIIVLLGREEDGSMLQPNARTPKAGVVWFEVDDDMIEGVDLAVCYVMDRCEELGLPLDQLQLETRTNPTPDRDDTSGTADVTIDVWPILLEVVDYKNGRIGVEHANNEQILAYLAGRAQDTGWSHDKYKITVVQPNFFHEEGRVRSFDISRADLEAFVIKHRAAAERSDLAADMFLKDPRLPLNPKKPDGPTWADEFLKAGSWCEMCPAAIPCPAKKRLIKQTAAADFDEYPTTEQLPTIDGAEEAAKVLAWAPLIMGQIKSARAYLTRAAMAGHAPEWKMVAARGKGVWQKGEGFAWSENTEGVDPIVLGKEMVAKGYITDNERALLMTTPELITGPAAEKLVPSKLRKAFRAEFMVTKPGAAQLAPVDDPREAVSFKPGDDFADDLGDE